MNACLIDFKSMPWECPATGIRQKAIMKDDEIIRLVEFSDSYVEAEWCKRDISAMYWREGFSSILRALKLNSKPAMVSSYLPEKRINTKEVYEKRKRHCSSCLKKHET